MPESIKAIAQETFRTLRRARPRLAEFLEQRVSTIRLAGCGGMLLVLLSLGVVLQLSMDDLVAALELTGEVDRVMEWAEIVGLHVLALLALSLIFELGPALARRVKKVGPIEFFAEEVRDVLPEVRKILARAPTTRDGPGRLVVTREALQLDRQSRYFTEKANALIYYIEYSELRDSSMVRDQDFLKLLSQMAGVALDQHHWARAWDRLELLDQLTKGRYEPEEIQKRRALAAMKLAETLTGRPDEEKRCQDLLRQARRAARRAVKLDPGDWQPLYFLGSVSYRLGHVGRARDLFKKATDLNPKHAPTKYNLACAYTALEEKEEALRWLESLKRKDDELEASLQFADQDPDLQPLRDDPATRGPLRQILEIRSSWVRKGSYPWLEGRPSDRSPR